MRKRILGAILILLCLIGLAKIFIPQNDASSAEPARQSKVRPVHHAKKSQKSAAEIARPYHDPHDLRSEGTWNKASEDKKYPSLKGSKKIIIRVSLRGNRVYILRHRKVLYTMLSTAGLYKDGKSLTPTGVFRIRAGRGHFFFNQTLNEGANNWVSWDPNNRNVYLFHSVPTKTDGRYNLKEAAKLGRTQGSHGCIRLSVPDSRWLMENIPVGTKVVIKDN